MNMNFSHINFAPFLIFIVLGLILVFAIERIGNSSSGAGGSSSRSSGGGSKAGESIMHFVEKSASNAKENRKRDEAQRALIRRIKISGLIAGLAFIIALISFFSLIGGTGTDESENRSSLVWASAGLIMGAVVAIAFTIRFIQFKRTYELYYGSLFGKKR